MTGSEPPLTSHVRYPDLRREVISALESLGDVEGMQARWGDASDPHYYDDLHLCVTVLYDLSSVLPDPATAVGTVIAPDEVEVLAAVERELGPLLDEMGSTDFRRFIGQRQWPRVVASAREAFRMLSQR